MDWGLIGSSMSIGVLDEEWLKWVYDTFEML